MTTETPAPAAVPPARPAPDQTDQGAPAGPPAAAEAPYGYRPDGLPYKTSAAVRKAVQDNRDRKRRERQEGHPGLSPSLEELRAAGEEEGERPARPGKDRAPRPGSSRRRRTKGAGATPDPEEVPYTAGLIAGGMNRLYARTGKIVRSWDRPLGQAIIAATIKVSPDDVTVGEAWDEIARTNPRIRAVLIKMIAGGAWSQLLWCHLPILLVVLSKPAIARRLPLHRLVESLLSDEDEEPGGAESEALGGLLPPDAGLMMRMVEQQFGAMFAGAQRAPDQPARAPMWPDGAPPPEQFMPPAGPEQAGPA